MTIEMHLFKSKEQNSVHYVTFATVPIEVDWRWLWSPAEFAAAADKSAV